MTRPIRPAELFGETPDGRSAMVYTLENSRLRVRITDYGGRMVSIEAPDRLGRRGDVLLGFDDVAAYIKAGGAFGALLGRNANRIAGGSFALASVAYNERGNDTAPLAEGGTRTDTGTASASVPIRSSYRRKAARRARYRHCRIYRLAGTTSFTANPGWNNSAHLFGPTANMVRPSR